MLQKRSRTSSGNLFSRLRRVLKNNLHKLTGFVPGAFPILLLLLFLFLAYNLFTIRRVDCEFNHNSCPAEVLDKTNKYLGTNVLLINQKELSSSMKDSFPIEKITIGFKIFNTLKLQIEGRLPALQAQVFLTSELPRLSLDNSLVSSESGVFLKPTEEISTLNQEVNFVSFDLWDNGLMTPAASSESKLKYLFTNKPDTETVKSIYKLVKIVDKYLNVEQYWILNRRVFLRQLDQPDIIINVPFDEETLVQALQSFAYLTTIKKDAKVIDLRFKNPILR